MMKRNDDYQGKTDKQIRDSEMLFFGAAVMFVITLIILVLL